MYPKEIGFIMLNMSIGPGAHVIEAGSGSGGFTTALAYMVGSEGHIYSYEIRKEMQNLARKNLERLGLESRVSLRLRDISEGFDERGVDALFLDLPNPWDYISQSYEAIKSGGHFGSLLPTTNQVTRLLAALRNKPFELVETCEVLLRYYKPIASKFRPQDRMVAHTGYLIFARTVINAN
jgi:tRNA (adenine57-N1/adenine58-N1)-methyltransferase